MRHQLLACLAAGASLSLSLRAQPPVQSLETRKVVAFDTGGLWHAAACVRGSDTLDIRSNYALAPASETLALSGVRDVARLDGEDAGDGESLVVVASADTHTVAWDDGTDEFVTTAWGDAALAGATAVRACAVVDQHLVGVLCADQRTVRIYRHVYGPILLATVVEGADVLDYEFFVSGGVPYVCLLTATGLNCRSLAGQLKWTAAGSGGDLTTLPSSGAGGAHVGWMHEEAGGVIAVGLYDELGLVDESDVAPFVPGDATLVQGLAADCDDDGLVDWVVKTDGAVVVVPNAGFPGAFDDVGQLPAQYTNSSQRDWEGDLVAGVGGRVRLVDGNHLGELRWLALASTGELPSTSFSLLNTGVVVDPAQNAQTDLRFDLELSASVLQDYTGGGNTSYFEVLAWRESAPGAGLDRVPAAAVWLELQNLPATINAATWWPIEVTLPPLLATGPTAHPWLWSTDEHYFVTVRLVLASAPGQPVAASESVTIATSMSDNAHPAYTYLLGGEHYDLDIGTSGLGGGVVGVITTLPPPSATKPVRPTEVQVAGTSTRHNNQPQ